MMSIQVEDLNWFCPRAMSEILANYWISESYPLTELQSGHGSQEDYTLSQNYIYLSFRIQTLHVSTKFTLDVQPQAQCGIHLSTRVPGRYGKYRSGSETVQECQKNDCVRF